MTMLLVLTLIASTFIHGGAHFRGLVTMSGLWKFLFVGSNGYEDFQSFGRFVVSGKITGCIVVFFCY